MAVICDRCQNPITDSKIVCDNCVRNVFERAEDLETAFEKKKAEVASLYVEIERLRDKIVVLEAKSNVG